MAIWPKQIQEADFTLYQTAWKVSKYGFSIHSEYGEIRTKKTPYLNTFHAVSNTTGQKEFYIQHDYELQVRPDIICKHKKAI